MTMIKKTHNVIILYSKADKKETFYQDLASVQRLGLIRSGKNIELSLLSKIIKRDGVFENAKYKVRKSFITIIKIK